MKFVGIAFILTIMQRVYKCFPDDGYHN